MSLPRLRIVHADTDDLENPLRGGQPVRTFSVNSRLAKRHDITVLTSVYKASRRRLVREGVRYRRLGLRIPGWGLSPHLSFMAFLGPAIARMPHDLVVEEFTPPVGFNGLVWWTKAPVILNVQWYFFEQWEKRYHLPFSRWMKRVARTGRYRHIMVQSDEMRRELQPFLPNATFCKVPSGVDDQAFIQRSSEGEYVLFLGRLDIEHKGLDLLLEAWLKVCGSRRIPLVIAGEGPARARLESQVRDAGLQQLIRFIGRVEGSAKREILERCRLMVMPSRYETFGIAALEAMAAAKPVVCFSIPHLNEIAMDPWAVHAPMLDAAGLGHAVAELWLHPERCAQMGEQGQAFARTMHWDQIARRQEDFYLQIHASHHEKT
ncbi:MAG TPA: glycosyltransferase family 4 protein [Opitutaceae bacterium]|nr:glycosyltransferase family 4 protein [Opitutaceae bacterium]